MGLNQTLIDITKGFGRGWNKGSDEEFESQRMVDRGQRMIPVQVQQQQAMQPGILAQAKALAQMKNEMELQQLQQHPLYHIAKKLFEKGEGASLPPGVNASFPVGGGNISFHGQKASKTPDEVREGMLKDLFKAGGTEHAEEGITAWDEMQAKRNAAPPVPDLKALTPSIQGQGSGFAQLTPVPPNPYPMAYQGVSLAQSPLESGLPPGPAGIEEMLTPPGKKPFLGAMGTRLQREGLDRRNNDWMQRVRDKVAAGMPLGQAKAEANQEIDKEIIDFNSGRTTANTVAANDPTKPGGGAKVALKGAITQKGIDVETDPANVQKEAGKAATIKTAQENVAFQPITVDTEYGPVSGPRTWVKGVVDGYADAASKGLSGEAQNKYSMYNRTLNDIDNMITLYKPEYVGKGMQAFFQDVKTNFDQEMNQLKTSSKDGRYGWYGGALTGKLSQWLGTGSPEEIAFRRSVIDATNAVIYAQSGAQINENEFMRNKLAMFDIYDEPATFVPSVIAARQRFQGQLVDLFKAASTPARVMKGQTENRPLPVPQGGKTAPPMEKPTQPQAPAQGSNRYRFNPATGQIEAVQ